LKRFLPVLAFLVFVLVALSCIHPEAKHDVVLLLLKTQTTPFFQEIQSGAESEAHADAGKYDLIVRAGTKEGDITAQRTILDSAYDQYVAGQPKALLRALLITPSASGPELIPSIKRLRDAGVPVIVIDTQLDHAALAQGATAVNAFVGSSNMDGGAKAAHIVAKRLPRGGSVLILNGVDGQETAKSRHDGFINGLVASSNAKYSIEEHTCNWQRNEARSSVESLLAFGKNFDAIFAANDEMALGAAEALRQHGKSGVTVVGFDAIPAAVDALKDGSLAATLRQQPRLMGSTAVKLARDVWAGRSPADVLIPVEALPAGVDR
jgi:ABC-type sugar transport system substrate-binding protein